MRREEESDEQKKTQIRGNMVELLNSCTRKRNISSNQQQQRVDVIPKYLKTHTRIQKKR